MFPGVLSTRLPGATRHVPHSRNVTVVVAPAALHVGRVARKEALGWHECTMLVCYTRIAHNLTQATGCCGESTGQFTVCGRTGTVDSMPHDLQYRVGPNKAVHVHWSDVRPKSFV